ncbi:MAG TPA: hypothetical protein OIM59_12685 [Bacteroides mediterraneensis]|uniref:hypothetical protein n=1 Tax=Bacteroides mediterraneensis TaxID=1841856 RepID=UPI0026ECE7F8|nr:hypothetical protein [Bacteroides mediterraneensis]HJH65462.1 hypothetical protein [Bacteroides mediterraneensis]
MKKYGYYLCAAVAITLLGCKEDVVEKPVIPAQTGDEIAFGSSLTDVGTRTSYDNEPTTEDGKSYYKVSWETGDQITIYCPEAAQTKLVDYSVTPDENDATHSSTVTKMGENGLQWGASETHHFYAFYPASAVEGERDGKIEGEIPTEQDPVSWDDSEKNEKGGTIYRGIANTDYAFMWAYGTHNKTEGGDVTLTFHPWVTILDIVINGPTEGEVKMSSVQVRSLNNDILNGKFVCNMSGVQDGTATAPTYEGVVNTASTRNQVSIELYDKTKKDFITLKPNDQIIVRAYLLPKAYDTSDPSADKQQIQIRVAPFNSSVLTRTLDAQGGTVDDGIEAHKVNTVILPPVSSHGTNYWMSSLDPNIFVTELSLPGSKMSYQTTANDASVAYQNLSITDQFKNGVRAFQIQTASKSNGNSASDQTLYMTVAEQRIDTPFKDIVEEIANELKTAETELAKTNNTSNEYAFILLTCAENACDRHSGGGLFGTSGTQAWMEAIETDLKAMANDSDPDKYRIYTDEIKPNTTINDVKGKIIIKVNYNNTTMGNHLASPNNIPAMFAQWGAVVDNSNDVDLTETDAYAINDLRWGTSNSSTASTMKWFYHESTRISDHEFSMWGNPYTNETYTQKEDNMKDMWNRSVTYYQDNDNHDMWFLNDIGGSYKSERWNDTNETQETVNALTAKINPKAVDFLQTRTDDATLGIVLINQIDPNDTYTGNLVQTIINNNFNFQLRTGSSSPTTTNYNAAYSKGGNAIGWDN